MASTQARAFAVSRPRPAEPAWRQMLRTLGLAERVMQPHFARFGITGSQWGVLRNLHRAELEGHAALRLTDLSERLLIRPPSVTGVVDRLERAGLVSRDGSPTDLRVKQVALTPRGRQLVERVLRVHAAQIEAVMGGLTAEEQAELHRLLSRLEGHLEELLQGGGVVEEE
jgi:DNA-binding MarR family transcriptional regulator